MTDTSPVLAARNLVKRYETSTPLNGADLTLHSGESVAVLGPSGSGKTSLLHILAGILVPDSGSVTLADGARGLDLAQLDSPRRAQVRRERFGFVFQHGALVPELTALENVALPLMLLGRSRQDAQTRADRGRRSDQRSLTPSAAGRRAVAERSDRRGGGPSSSDSSRTAPSRRWMGAVRGEPSPAPR